MEQHSQYRTRWCEFFWRSHGCRWGDACYHCHYWEDFAHSMRPHFTFPYDVRELPADGDVPATTLQRQQWERQQWGYWADPRWRRQARSNSSTWSGASSSWQDYDNNSDWDNAMSAMVQQADAVTQAEGAHTSGSADVQLAHTTGGADEQLTHTTGGAEAQNPEHILAAAIVAFLKNRPTTSAADPSAILEAITGAVNDAGTFPPATMEADPPATIPASPLTLPAAIPATVLAHIRPPPSMSMSPRRPPPRPPFTSLMRRIGPPPRSTSPGPLPRAPPTSFRPAPSTATAPLVLVTMSNPQEDESMTVNLNPVVNQMDSGTPPEPNGHVGRS